MAANAKTKNANNAPNAAARQEKRKLRRGLLMLGILLLMLVGCALALWWLKHRMFEKNPNLILRQVNVDSRGYWGKSAASRRRLIEQLKIEIGKDNLFELNVKQLRSQLRNMPNIADAQVQIILPDTLAIELEERIPRAFLGRTNSNLVADANGMVMLTKESFGVHPNLPVIVGLRNTEVQAGHIQSDLREALNLIMSTQHYSCFKVELVSISHPNELIILMQYRKNKLNLRYQVTMPCANYREYLNILQSAIEDALRHNDRRNKINLTFADSVVLSS